MRSAVVFGGMIVGFLAGGVAVDAGHYGLMALALALWGIAGVVAGLDGRP